MRIRPASNQDRDAITSLIFSVLQEYGLRPDPATTDADLADVEANYFAGGGRFDVVVDDDDVIVGSVGLFRVDRDTCELRKMYLRRDARGQGLGRRLVEHAIDHARRRHADARQEHGARLGHHGAHLGRRIGPTVDGELGAARPALHDR